jgi:hypothetical protein
VRAYTTLRELVRSCGGTLIEEHMNADARGSAQAVFASRSKAKFRFVWDGKESCGFLQPDGADAKSQGQPAVVRKPAGANFCNLHEFLTAAERLSEDVH